MISQQAFILGMFLLLPSTFAPNPCIVGVVAI
jgi:hypothetical protein